MRGGGGTEQDKSHRVAHRAQLSIVHRSSWIDTEVRHSVEELLGGDGHGLEVKERKQKERMAVRGQIEMISSDSFPSSSFWSVARDRQQRNLLQSRTPPTNHSLLSTSQCLASLENGQQRRTRSFFPQSSPFTSSPFSSSFLPPSSASLSLFPRSFLSPHPHRDLRPHPSLRFRSPSSSHFSRKQARRTSFPRPPPPSHPRLQRSSRARPPLPLPPRHHPSSRDLDPTPRS